jgi:hypothetical protein
LSFILDQINRLEQKLNKLSVEISQNENNEKSKVGCGYFKYSNHILA